MKTYIKDINMTKPQKYYILKRTEFYDDDFASDIKDMLEEALEKDPEAVVSLESTNDGCYGVIEYYEKCTPEEYWEMYIEEELEEGSQKEENYMSDVMLMGVLRMPPEIWGDGEIDKSQRFSRYIEAADRINAQEREIELLKATIDNLVDRAMEIVATQKIPSAYPDQEMAVRWTKDALREVWVKLKSLKSSNV